ncbi:MAG: hypothetical protein IKV91_03435 [Bacteroidales bacterium]|nr:hypothetical protein [Bacteroidales bacterium]
MKNWMKLFLRPVFAFALAASALSSCYDDSALWDKVTEMDDRLTVLENELTSQAEALGALLSNGATLTSCVKNSDGSYTVTLSDGTKFNVLPNGTDFSKLVTYIEEDGKKYWATYGPDGKPVVLKDGNKNIPVSVDISVKVEDGVYYLVIDGKDYVTGYDAEDVVQVFSSCTPLADASGNVYAVKFTFGEGMEVTVALDGYKGVIFKISNVNNDILTEYYVDYGRTQSFLLEKQGVVDYVMQVPDGWRVKETVEELTGETYVSVTAPKAETVALGAAVADGDLKVVSVVDGGKAAVSRIYLTTDPFKTYNVSPLKAVIAPTFGIEKFAYGMMLTHDFDKDAVLSKVGEILDASADLPAGYFLSEGPVDTTLEELYGSELSVEVSYTFWAVPALYNDGSEDESEAGYYVEADMLRTLVLNPMSATVQVLETSLLDAEVAVSVAGAESVYAGTTLMTETTIDEIVYQINNGIIEPVAGPVRYQGPASEFPNEESTVYMSPDTDYITWIVPVENDKTAYTAGDVVYQEFRTKAVADGGSIALTVGEFTTSASSISAEISSEGAAMIYYAYLNSEDGSRYSTASNDVKMSKILAAERYAEIRDDSTVASVDGIHPETEMWLYSVAVGHDGKYGEVVCKSAKTGKVSFNDLSLSVEAVLVKDKEATLKVTVSGGEATDFIYWVGYEKDPFWASENYCNTMKTTAQKYMAANPDAEEITKVMRRNGPIAEDGTITLTELSMNTIHVFLVMAKDASGNYSKVGYFKFQTLAADLGELVLEDNPKWAEAKKFIEDNIKWDENYFHASASEMGYAAYAFDIKIPTDLTAFITCFGTKATQMTDVIVEIEEYASRKVSVGKVIYDENGQQPTNPDWYDDKGKFIQGSLVNIYDMYPHGSPTLAAVTYFSSNGHEDGHCSGWNDDTDSCSNYDYFKKAIHDYCSLEYWKEYIIDFGNFWYNGDPDHEYSRTLQDPARIEAIAQQYLDIYYPYYKDAEPMVYVNDGSALRVTNREAMGPDENGVIMDMVTVVLKDGEGNYYQPIYIPVPNYFK